MPSNECRVEMISYVLCGSDTAPVLVWANTSKSSWAGGGLQLDRELSVLLTLSAPMSAEEHAKKSRTKHKLGATLIKSTDLQSLGENKMCFFQYLYLSYYIK